MFAAPVPNEPQFVGNHLHFQALYIYSVNGRPLFTNDVVATIMQ